MEGIDLANKVEIKQEMMEMQAHIVGDVLYVALTTYFGLSHDEMMPYTYVGNCI